MMFIKVTTRLWSLSSRPTEFRKFPCVVRCCYTTSNSNDDDEDDASNRTFQRRPDPSLMDDTTNTPPDWDTISAVVYPNVITELQENLLSSILSAKFQRSVHCFLSHMVKCFVRCAPKSDLLRFFPQKMPPTFYTLSFEQTTLRTRTLGFRHSKV
jgi:hypothetical protein